MSETTVRPGRIQESKKTTLLKLTAFVFIVALPIKVLMFHTYGSWSASVTLITLVIMYVLGRKWAFMHAMLFGFSLLAILISAIVPAGYLKYTMEGVKLVQITDLVSPFAHERPIEKAPSRTGSFNVNNLPDKWTVHVSYWIPPDITLKSEEWLILKKLVSEEVVIPSALLTLEGNPATSIEKYFEEKYPFMRVDARVVYREIKTWK